MNGDHSTYFILDIFLNILVERIIKSKYTIDQFFDDLVVLAYLVIECPIDFLFDNA